MKNKILTFLGAVLAAALLINCEPEHEPFPPGESSDAVESPVDIKTLLPTPQEIGGHKEGSLVGRTFNQNEYVEDFKTNPDNGWIIANKFLGVNKDFPWYFYNAKVYDIPFQNSFDNELHIQSGGFAAMSFFYHYGASYLTFDLSSTISNIVNGKIVYEESCVDLYLFYDNQWNYYDQYCSSGETVETDDPNEPFKVDLPGAMAIAFSPPIPSHDVRMDNIQIVACSGSVGPATSHGYDNDRYNRNLLGSLPSGCQPNQNTTNWDVDIPGNGGNSWMSVANNGEAIAEVVRFHASADWMGNTVLGNDAWDDECWDDYDKIDLTNNGFHIGQLIDQGFRSRDQATAETTFQYHNAFALSPYQDEFGPWREINDYLQNLILNSDKEAYISVVPYGYGGENEFGDKLDWIIAGPNIIRVPQKLCLVALILPNGTSDECRIADAEMLGFIIDNKVTVLPSRIVSVDEVESLTGYDFFSEIKPDWAEDFLEAQVYVP